MSERFNRWICLGCGFSYDEALGLPEHGIAPGTRWADVPEDWVCICAFVLEGELTHINTAGKGTVDRLRQGDYYVFSAGSGGSIAS